MKRLHYPILLALFASPAILPAAETQPVNTDQYRAMLKQYCQACHNAQLKNGGVAFDKLELTNLPDDAQVWEKVLRKLRGHLMPPPGAPQPPQKDVDSLVAWTENTLDTQAKGPKAGRVPIERLNRTEYAAEVKTLVGVDVNAKDILPQDIRIDGFDNIAAALNISPAFLTQYIEASRHIAKQAVGNPNPRVSNQKYLINAYNNPDDPLPPGMRGGVRFKHNFVADGEYRININDLGAGLYTAQMESESTLVIMVDGKIALKRNIGGAADLAEAQRRGADGRAAIMERFTKIPVNVKAGMHDVVVGFIERAYVESDDNVAGGGGFGGPGGFGAGNGRMARLGDGIEVTGPYNPTGVSTTPSRALIFVCDPQKPAAKPTGDAACAKQITETLARRAYRRPVTQDDMARLMPFYEAGRENGGSFDQGIEQVVSAVLSSPDFLFRSIEGRKASSADAASSLTDLELASRLSFFVWNTGPDDELLKLASSNQLSKPGVLDAQVKRMMADARAESLVTSFAMKWLTLDDLDLVKPDPEIFRNFNEQLRHDFMYEVTAFISSILMENRSVVDLLTDNHTFLNDRLARHYGITGVTGSQFREVTLTDKERFGLFGKAAVLMRTSYGDRTSPVLRGAWVLDKIIGTPPSPPPPNVNQNLAQKSGEAPKTVRERLESHRNQATCKQCHGVIDPTGLALENFDAIGQWRDTDRQANNAKIDASTVLPSGIPINGPIELREQLVAHPDTFVRAFTEKLMMYAVNRELEYYDEPQIRRIVRSAAKDNYKLTTIVEGIVNSDAFRKQGPAAVTTKAETQQVASK